MQGARAESVRVLASAEADCLPARSFDFSRAGLKPQTLAPACPCSGEADEQQNQSCCQLPAMAVEKLACNVKATRRVRLHGLVIKMTLHIGGQVPGAGITLCRIRGHGLEDDALQITTQLCVAG